MTDTWSLCTTLCPAHNRKLSFHQQFHQETPKRPTHRIGLAFASIPAERTPAGAHTTKPQGYNRHREDQDAGLTREMPTCVL